MARVVVVDDDHASEIMVENLNYRGHDACRIKSAQDALDRIDQVAEADIVVLDVIMERPANQNSISGDKTTGMLVLKAIRKANSTVPILIYSANNDRELIDTLRRLPHTKYISKWNAPSLSEFIDQIEQIVGHKAEAKKPNSFIVHGHDEKEKLALKNYLQNTLNLPEPIILHEQPSFGKAIIEKLEHHASAADLVFVLLTPDDKLSANEADNDKRRARQNVIFELGYFFGILGRASGRVVLLHKGTLDLPSDISGLIYIDISGGIASAGEAIRKELSHVL